MEGKIMKLLDHILFSISLFFASNAYVFDVPYFDNTPALNLPTHEWKMIALPAASPAAANTVESIFDDDISGGYGSTWVLFEYDTQGGGYNWLQSST